MKPRSFMLQRLAPLMMLALAVTAAAQGTFPAGSTFSAGDGQGNTIAMTYDTAGGMWIYVNGEGLGSYSYTVKDEEVEFKEAQMPQDYSCGAVVGKYKWKLEGQRLIFTVVEDSCEIRAQYFGGLQWTRNAGQRQARFSDLRADPR